MLLPYRIALQTAGTIYSTRLTAGSLSWSRGRLCRRSTSMRRACKRPARILGNIDWLTYFPRFHCFLSIHCAGAAYKTCITGDVCHGCIAARPQARLFGTYSDGQIIISPIHSLTHQVAGAAYRLGRQAGGRASIYGMGPPSPSPLFRLISHHRP